MNRATGAFDVADILSSGNSCKVELPAGHGKTELLVNVATQLTNNGSTILILTHTNAGVRALRRRFYSLRTQISEGIKIQTIDSFTKAWALAFPTSCGFQDRGEVETSVDFELVEYGVGEGLSKNLQMCRILKSCHNILLVDEYQDCSLTQRDMISRIRVDSAIPVLTVGDNFQSIFNHDETRRLTSSQSSSLADLQSVDIQTTPWRWEPNSRDLGDWISDFRLKLETERPASFAPYLHGVSPNNHQHLPYSIQSHCDVFENLVLVERIWSRGLALAKSIGAQFQMHERRNHCEFADLAAMFDRESGSEITSGILQIVASSSVKFGQLLSAQQIASISQGTVPRLRNAEKRVLLDLVHGTMKEPTPSHVSVLLKWLLSYQGIRVFRRPMLNELGRILDAMQEHGLTFSQGIDHDRRNYNVSLPNYLVTTPWLFKGLQASNVVVMRPETMSPKELYVSVSRATDNLWIYSDCGQFNNY